jgi:hypothetical protein
VLLSRSTVNRVLLALVGVLLLVGGLLVLAGGVDLYARWGLHPPGWWPLTSPSQPVLSNASRTRWHDRGWWWPAVIAGLVLLVVLTGCWLAFQLRRAAPVELELPAGGVPGLRVRLRGAALAGAVREAATGLPSIEDATVRLVGRQHRHRRLSAVLLLAPGSDVRAVVHTFRTGPLAHAREAVPHLPLDLRIRVAPSPAPHHRPHRRRRRRKPPRVR